MSLLLLVLAREVQEGGKWLTKHTHTHTHTDREKERESESEKLLTPINDIETIHTRINSKHVDGYNYNNCKVMVWMMVWVVPMQMEMRMMMR
jgi:hypothetical protein